MPSIQNRRLSTSTLAADHASALALRQIITYAPANPAISNENIAQLQQRLREAEEAEILAEQALENARDARTNAGWVFHNALLDAKAAIRSQYGANSDELQSVGLKKKDDYRRPSIRRRS